MVQCVKLGVPVVHFPGLRPTTDGNFIPNDGLGIKPAGFVTADGTLADGGCELQCGVLITVSENENGTNERGSTTRRSSDKTRDTTPREVKKIHHNTRINTSQIGVKPYESNSRDGVQVVSCVGQAGKSTPQLTRMVRVARNAFGGGRVASRWANASA